MNMKSLPTKAFVIIAAVVLLIMFAAIIFILFTSSPNPDASSPPTPTQPIVETVPPIIRDVPTIAPEQGGGIDKNSPIIQGSIVEIQKLSPRLPYSLDFTSSTGVEVSILIPNQSLQANTWTLRTQVFGINYNTSEEQPDYQSMRVSFLEAADRVFEWVRQNGADPEKVIYIWGDRKFIQDQAEKWLRS